MNTTRPRLVICTTGTSIASGCKATPSYQKQPAAWTDPALDLREQIQARMAGFDLGTAEGRTRASAELNSLHRLGISGADRIVLLATDTADGHACADALQSACATAFGLATEAVEIHRVAGLQVRDEKRLQREGLPALIERVLFFVETPQIRHSYEIVINPTGGFKGVVPFLTALGSLFRLPTIYVFEYAEALIHLPPLPLTFDIHLFERALPAMELVQRESFVPETAFFDRITGFQDHERDLFQCFIESADRGMVTLSPLALALYRIEEGGAHSVHLTPAAARQLASAEGLPRTALERILARISHPLWRSLHQHIRRDPLVYYKPGNTAQRAAAVVQGDKVIVCALFASHEDYERDLAHPRTAWPVPGLVEWNPPGELDATEARYWSELETENEQLRMKLQTTIQETSRDKAEAVKAWRERSETANALYRKAADSERRLTAEVVALKRENSLLQSRIASQARTDNPGEPQPSSTASQGPDKP